MFKYRYLIVTRKENLTDQQRKTLRTMVPGSSPSDPTDLIALIVQRQGYRTGHRREALVMR